MMILQSCVCQDDLFSYDISHIWGLKHEVLQFDMSLDHYIHLSLLQSNHLLGS